MSTRGKKVKDTRTNTPSPQYSLAYARGYELGIERARELVTTVCNARAMEIPDERVAIAFTRERILAALVYPAEKAAAMRVAAERALQKGGDQG